jgi:hypothetical protein
VVHEHDTALDQLQHQIEAMPERIALIGVRARQTRLIAAIADAQFEIDDLGGRQAVMEEQIAAVADGEQTEQEAWEAHIWRIGIERSGNRSIVKLPDSVPPTMVAMLILVTAKASTRRKVARIVGTFLRLDLRTPDSRDRRSADPRTVVELLVEHRQCWCQVQQRRTAAKTNRQEPSRAGQPLRTTASRPFRVTPRVAARIS